MNITPYHAKYFAHELTKRSAEDSPKRFASILADAKVDLNPHQIEAALFAFRSPFSQGAILADEVGLGKTIEAGILISQQWAELKRKILIIVPASLRKQWSQELQEKFYIPSAIIDGKIFKDSVANGKRNPFDRNKIVICSYHFAYNQAEYIETVNWDLAVVDEAHRLRNVYKKENKIAKSIKETLKNTPKVLLTATPLQNSLLELYGLVSVIDEYLFGDFKSYKSQYSRLLNQSQYSELKERLKPICQRTLRRQVLEYIQFTNRLSITQAFTPTAEEQQLHDWIVEYLQRDKIYAFSDKARQLITLILLKLLASSSFAIAGTLDSLINRLESLLEKAALTDNLLDKQISQDVESFEETKEEWQTNEIQKEEIQLTKEELEGVKDEVADLTMYRDLAYSITINAKAEKLVPALNAGFEKANQLGAEKKAVIFTESRRTQKYLYDLLERTEYQGKVILFNGTNDDDRSKEIYHHWLKRYQDTDKITGSKQSDIRQAIIDYFREHAEILIATEAAAEGINLQFCSLVVNYDLPWNPQRIEQRIGRCHRYGQKYDVVVVNFLNEANLADQRVFQLLNEKFKLFDGVFGTSDEILGAIESGIDLEQRIIKIYQECRTAEEINQAFDGLQKEFEQQISTQMKKARRTLLEHFDEEVHEKLRTSYKLAQEYLSKFDRWLWDITFFKLREFAHFDDENQIFRLFKNPFPQLNIPMGIYQMNKHTEEGYTYRFGHPLSQELLREVKSQHLEDATVLFDYTHQPKKISILQSLVKRSGYLMLSRLHIKALEDEDHLIFSGISKEGEELTEEQCIRMFSLLGRVTQTVLHSPVPSEKKQLLTVNTDIKRQRLLTDISERNSSFFEQEIEKLDKWADDKRNSSRLRHKDLQTQLDQLKKKARLAPNLPEKLKNYKRIRLLEQKRENAWKYYERVSLKIDKQKDELIDKIEKRLKQDVTLENLFTIQWEII